MIEFNKLRLRKRIVFAIGVFLGFLILVGILNYTIYQYYNTNSTVFFNETTGISKTEHEILNNYQTLSRRYDFVLRGGLGHGSTSVKPNEMALPRIYEGILNLGRVDSIQSDSLVRLVQGYVQAADSAIVIMEGGQIDKARHVYGVANAHYGDRFVSYLTQVVQNCHNRYVTEFELTELKRKQLIILILFALFGLFCASLLVYRYYMQNISRLKYTADLQRDVQTLSTKLSQKLLNQNDTRLYDRALLDFMVDHTEAQTAAVFSYDAEKKECLLRTDNQFATGNSVEAYSYIENRPLEIVLDKKEITYLRSFDNNFEIAVRNKANKILIPILQNGEVVIIIAISFARQISERTERFLNEMWSMFMLGYIRVATYEKVKRFGEKVDDQNRELEHKTKELILQSEELKESNVELQMQKMQLDEANQMKTKFLSNMSHELRTPLNSIIALTGVLSRKLNGFIGEKDNNYLDVILRNGKHLLSLINEVLDLARIEAGAMEVNREEFSMIGLVESVMESVDPLVNEKSIELKKTFLNGDVLMFSDRAKCYHILQNIVSNAVKFTNEGYIDISLEFDEMYGYVRIKDTGVGIPQENLPHIFDEFHQVFGSKNEYEGTGLGLSIAYKYCNLLNGDISVKSVLDKGAEFCVKLPLSEKQLPGAIPSYTRTWFGEAKSVLLIELDQGKSKFIKNELDQLKIPVVVARTIEKALNILLSIVPECIILVGQNSKSNEVALLGRIREIKDLNITPILLLTDSKFDDRELSELKSRKNAFVTSHASVLLGGLKLALDRLLYSESKSAAKHPKRAVLDLKSTKGRVLIIEDNNECLQIMEESLVDNHIVYSANDGFLGAEKARLLNPDIILIDITLPGKDGIVLMKELKFDKRTAHIPIMALTTKVVRDEREELIGYGFDDYIAKPVDNILLNTTINNWLYGE